MKSIYKTLLVMMLIVFLLSNISFSAPAADNGAKKKIVVLCFDGVDARKTEEYMQQGHLPNLSKLAEKGVYSPLDTTNPPQTPVSWASFTTGWHPGKTEIFDFLKRIPGTYLPTFCSMSIISNKVFFGKNNPIIFGLIGGLVIFLLAFILLRLIIKKTLKSLIISISLFVIVFILIFFMIRAWVPIETVGAENNRKGVPFWDVLNENGVKTKVYNIPVTFPATGIENGYLLAGLGVPDITGSIGKPAYYTTSKIFGQQEREFTVEFTRLNQSQDGIYYTFIHGPDLDKFKFFGDEDKDQEVDMKSLSYLDEEAAMKNTPEYMFKNNEVLVPDDKSEPLGIPMKLQVDIKDKSVTIEIQGSKQTIKEGEWSDWFELRFKITPVVSLWGIARFALQEVSPELRLYLSPINLHPDYSPIPITFPKKWAKELYDKYGMYKTLGWAVDTWSLQEELINEKSFLEDAYYTRGRKEVMLLDSLDDFDYQVHVQYFEYTDRIQHLFWRFIDEKHPAYRPELAEKYKQAILDSYKDMDRIVGEVAKKLDDNCILFVISDHGFLSWRYAINYNTWLKENGYITVKDYDVRQMELEDLFGERTENFWPNVDWTKTKAYALGIGNIYLNVKGREPEGILDPVEYEKVRDEIIEKMPRMVDPKTGMHPIIAVYKREDIWDEFDLAITPDLRVCTNDYYRVSWQSTLGNIPKNMFYDNARTWCADHCSADPSLVHGIFFCNKKITKKSNPKLVDFFPTILSHFEINPDKYNSDGVDIFVK